MALRFSNNKFENLLIFFLTYICRSGKLIFAESTRRDVRVVEGARLESVYTGNCIKGSNPFLSASKKVVESCLQTEFNDFFVFYNLLVCPHVSVNIFERTWGHMKPIYILYIYISITSPVNRVSILLIYCSAI